MSSFNLTKKLKPAKKAWNSFTIQVRYKFKNFSISKTIKNTKKHFISALHKIHSLIIPHKISDLLRSRRRCRYNLYHHHRCQHPPIQSYETVYIDELFPNNSFDEQHKMVVKKTSSDASSSFSTSLPKVDDEIEENKQVCGTTKTVVSKGVKILEHKRGRETSKSIIGDDDGLKLSLLSKFRGIDERAEEFISKFKEDKKLESEKSILDFEEMLARGV